MILGLALGGAVMLWGSSIPRPTRSKEFPLAHLAALLEVAVAGGLSVFGALREVAALVGGEAAAEVNAALRAARSVGLAEALQSNHGPLAPLLRPLARPVRTGAAAQPVLSGLRRSIEAQQLTDLEARLERLPVKLVFPLALLMLPGLLLMIVAPSLLDVFSRLG